jgi:hypothetical protein
MVVRLKSNSMKIRIAYLFLMMAALTQSGCYSFQGIVIDPDVKTYYVNQFVNSAPSVVPTLAPDFTEDLKDKIRNESRLIYTEVDPDIEFSGTITEYRVSSEAPQPGELVAFNRLTITIAVEYENHKHPAKASKFNVSWYAEYPANANLLTVQDQLIREISVQLVEDIFTKAFTNW